MAEPFDVVVVGSINIDLVMRVARPPRPGETVMARDLVTIPGGKGANQAVGAARLGARTALIGRVGRDDFGTRLLNELKAQHVDIRHVTPTDNHATGVAMITVDEKGENAICVAAGANHRLTPSDVDAAAETLRRAKVCLMQLELPLATVEHAIELCRKAGVETILDPAPAPDRPPRALFGVDIICPNLLEAQALTQESPGTHAEETRTLAAALAAYGAKHVVIKLGERGAVVCDGNGCEVIPPHRITPVDTTAAGDAFAAALGYARAKGDPLLEAAHFANAAGAAACLKFGAQPSLPTLHDVLQLRRA